MGLTVEFLQQSNQMMCNQIKSDDVMYEDISQIVISQQPAAAPSLFSCFPVLAIPFFLSINCQSSKSEQQAGISYEQKHLSLTSLSQLCFLLSTSRVKKLFL